MTEPATGSWNMAVDEVLLHSLTAESVPILRFYAWRPATLSLGYFQSLADRTRHPASIDCEITRRLSGGGAILHHHELTYSVMLPPGHPESKNVQPLYDLFHQTLIETLRDWKVEAKQCEAPVKRPAAEEPFLCFQRRATGDVLLDGHKICGSAQRRLRGAILQHGSILLARGALAPELPGVSDLTSGELNVEGLRAAWLERLSATWGVRWEPDTLSAAERTQAERLATDKYGCSNWVGRR